MRVSTMGARLTVEVEADNPHPDLVNDMCRRAYDLWTEANEADRKLRAEMKAKRRGPAAA